MIVGIGCDIVDHRMTSELRWSSDMRIQRRIFTSEEMNLCKNHEIERFLSGRFAVKEAVLKCLGTGMRDGLALTDIQVLQTTAGQPLIHIQGGVERLVKTMNINRWHVSISHTEHMSTAYVIAER
jgi:holo-[acyl-carrier protein] synthase